jgi:hypothetical protein
MPNISEIKEIWILSRNGLTLFNQKFDTNAANTQLIGGFVSAVHNFSQLLEIGQCQCIDFGEYRICFSLAEECGLLIVGLMDNKIKEKRSIEILNVIKKNFIDSFKDYLENLKDGLCDLTSFNAAKDSFNLNLKEWLKIPIEETESNKILSLS